MRFFIFAALTLIFSSDVFAGDVETTPFVISKVRISSNTGIVYIKPQGTTEAKNSTCSKEGLYAFHKDVNLFNQIYSTALAAASSGKPVKVWISTDSNDCVNGYQKVTVMEVNF